MTKTRTIDLLITQAVRRSNSPILSTTTTTTPTPDCEDNNDEEKTDDDNNNENVVVSLLIRKIKQLQQQDIFYKKQVVRQETNSTGQYTYAEIDDLNEERKRAKKTLLSSPTLPDWLDNDLMRPLPQTTKTETGPRTINYTTLFNQLFSSQCRPTTQQSKQQQQQQKHQLVKVKVKQLVGVLMIIKIQIKSVLMSASI